MKIHVEKSPHFCLNAKHTTPLVQKNIELLLRNLKAGKEKCGEA
ncbi:hypothetical protein ANH9381_1730 [Aggregatibacter actinomycetemcomitans ANH9381]|nr:hypothetical protein ANH9381_1730 [Aggregatibacter actinomycetemcomitans ANH9381]